MTPSTGPAGGNGREAILARKHWVFDLDGTLTLPVHDFTVIRRILGVPEGTDILGHLAALGDAEGKSLRDKLNDIEIQLLERIQPAPGMLPLMEALRGRGARFGILTRNTREVAQQTVDRLGIGRFFSRECILGRDDTRPKPDPGGIFHLCALWDATPAELVMVGDYLFDLQTGSNAGTATVHVDRNRSFPWPELTDIGVGSLQELRDMLPA
ncbi:MAG: HAD family hydrolase [Thermodesulfobacteriota bacterium]